MCVGWLDLDLSMASGGSLTLFYGLVDRGWLVG